MSVLTEQIDELNQTEVNPDEIQIAQEARLGDDRFDTNPVQGDTVNTEVVENTFPSPFGGRIGKSSVDLSQEGANDRMLEEYDNAWKLDNEDSESLKESFHQKYYGLTTEEFKEQRIKDYYRTPATSKLPVVGGALESLRIPGLAVTDFLMDATGTLGGPWGAELDDKWDRATMMDNPVHENIRKVLSVLLPAIYTGGKTNQFLTSQGIANLPWLSKHMIRLGAWQLEAAFISGLSDTSEGPNLSQFTAELIPGIFGADGMLPLPEAWKTKDSMSPAAKKRLNMWNDAGLVGFGSIIGTVLDSGKLFRGPARQTMDWFEPLDPKAQAYKELEIAKQADPDILIEIQKIDELISIGDLNKRDLGLLYAKKRSLMDEILRLDDVDNNVRKADSAAEKESFDAAQRKIDSGDEITELDPDITPGLQDANKGARDVPREGSVARNMADTTAIKTGMAKGDPANVVTESMMRKGFMIGPRSRNVVQGIAEAGKEAGRFDALVDGFRFTAKQMNAAAWDIYTSIVDPGASLGDVKELFLENRNVVNMLMGRFKVEVINEEQARAAAFALRDLVDKFLGREVTEASARVMDTLGRESATLAETVKTMKPYVDDTRVTDLILDKMEFLMDEYALNKYISGWTLRNKNWFDQAPPKQLEEVIDTLTQEFTSAENAIHARNRKFTKTLKQLRKDNPLAMRPLVDAFAHSNGDVDTLAKLHKFAEDALTPVGMIKSPNPKQMNLFAKGAWSVAMNNVLSGLAAPGAMVGNLGQLVAKPITQFLGHFYYGFEGKGFDGLRQLAYMHGSIFETNRRSMIDAFEMMKKSHKDPELLLKMARKDFTLKRSKEWTIMDDMVPVWENEKNWGMLFQYNTAKFFTDMGQNPNLRWGMTGLTFPDAYTNTHLMQVMSRLRAYDEVFSEFGFADWKKIHLAEKRIMNEAFDENGLLKDKAVKAMSGEVALNLDDGLATWMNQATTAYPASKVLFMFPRTQSNAVKVSASWLPLTEIKGFSKYAATLHAKTPDEIAAALKQHGIDAATDPNAQAIFETLRAEYKGRQIAAVGITGLLWQWAMAGNINGPGHHDASIRRKEREQGIYIPDIIKVGDTSIPIDLFPDGPKQILKILGSASYYTNHLSDEFYEDLQAKIMWTLSATYLGDVPFQGFETLLRIFDGDGNAMKRLLKSISRLAIPQSSGMALLAKGIDPAIKELEDSILKAVLARIPFASYLVRNKRDTLTGEYLNDCLNPLARRTNAIIGFPTSCTQEQWRKDLQQIGFNGVKDFEKSSSGDYEYSGEEKDIIQGYLADRRIFRGIKKILNKPSNKRDIKKFEAYRTSNKLNQDNKLNLYDLPIHRELKAFLAIEHKLAEERLIRERPEIANEILHRKYAKTQMKAGDVEGAEATMMKLQETQELLQMAK